MERLEEGLEEMIKILTEMKGASSGRARYDPKAIEAELMEQTKKYETTLDIDRYQRLIRMMRKKKNNVEALRDFLNEHHPEALMAENIDDFGNTIFHLIAQEPDNRATIKLLAELVREVSAKTLEKLNVNGLTALQVAACAGNTAALQVLANKNQSLLSIQDEGGWLPIHHAAAWSREKTVQHLLRRTDMQAREKFDSDLLLYLLICSDLPGLALELLKKQPRLATPDKYSCWGKTVNMLAKKPLGFKSGRKLGIWKSLIYSYIPVNDDEDRDPVAWPPLDDDIEMQNILPANNSKKIPILPQIGALEKKLYTLLWNILIQLVPCIKCIHDQKHKHSQRLEVVRGMISKVNWTYNRATENLKKPLLKAAKLGIDEFVNEVLQAYPNSVLFLDEEGHNIFLLAILHRKENVFSLIHDQPASIRDNPSYIRDIHGHNILHLAGKMLVPPSEVPGAALQMQRELQWFKGIRHLFHPSLREQQNDDGLTPIELFNKEHADLMEKGEKWMRDTATSCSVVGALIITIAFAAAFTVPGGLDPNGVPVYLNNNYFRIFAVSVALALFASTTSVQMFLGMLTSRYAEDDFLWALPNKLIIGLATLFLSSTSMMVAFGAAFCIALSHPWKWAIILILVLGSLPVTSYALMQFPLLFVICRSTYGPGILKQKKYA